MSTALITRLFAEAGNTLKATPTGFACGHEPRHTSTSGTCVSITAEKALWYCTSCQQGGDAVKAVESLLGLSREAAIAHIKSIDPEAEAGKRGDSQATQLVQLAIAAEVTLWHTPARDPWASFTIDRHTEHAPISTKAFRWYLRKLFHEAHGTSPGSQGIQDALGVLEAKAVYDGPEHPVAVRIAEHDGRIYLDLANERWEVIEIDRTGWRIITDPPVFFERPHGLLALPTPVAGGSLELLRPFVNVSDEDFILLKAWLLGALSAAGPYPILELHGEQGSAKSTHARVLRLLLDPSLVPLRRPPRDERSLIIAGAASWVLAIDNLSFIPAWLSDALCCVSTGGGLADRALYTDGEVFLIDLKRPVILTGIEDLATRGDLLDRVIPLFLNTIAETDRVAEDRFWKKFETVRPRILGALLDAMSCALKKLPSTQLPATPRMADFALQVVAASEQLGFTAKEFLAAYTDKRAELHASALESNLVAQLIIKLVADTPFKGTALSLLTHLTILADDKEKKAKVFPANARAMGNAVRRIAPNLRAEGYQVEFPREPGTGTRYITLEWVRKFASQTSQTSQTAETQDFFRDANENFASRADDFASRADEHDTDEDGGCDANAPNCDATVTQTVSFASQKNNSDTEHLNGKDTERDVCDAKMQPYSSGSTTQEFDWENGETIEVSETDPAGLFELILTASQLEAVLPDLLAAPVIALDTETTGLDPLKDRVRLIQLALPSRTIVIDAFTCPVRVLEPLFAQPRQFIGHNIKFDLKMLMAAGLPWPVGEVFDTEVAARVLGASSMRAATGTYTLKAVTKNWLGIHLDKTEQVSDWSGALTHEQLLYAAKDADILLPLAKCLNQALTEATLTRIATIEHRCLPAIAQMEMAGLPLDEAAWRSRATLEEHRAEALSTQLASMVDAETLAKMWARIDQEKAAKANGKAPKGKGKPRPVGAPINWSSTQQVLALFHVRGHTLANTTSETIETLIGKDDLAVPLLDYREADKRAGTYGEKWANTHLHPVSGRVHPDFLQLGSEAGRMSCVKPNMQNLPRNGEYRQTIRARDGFAIVKADYSQIELRIAAVIAQEDTMLTAFRNGDDLHRLTASKVFGVPIGRVKTEQRYIAKSLNFGLLYGMGAKALQQYIATNCKIAVSEQEAKAHHAAFFRAYPGLRRWHARTGGILNETPSIETRTMAGRRRLGISKFTVALNSPVQGAGADGMKNALALLWEHRSEAPDAQLIGCIHDEVLAECPIHQADATAAWLERYMIEGMVAIIGDAVPVEVETTIGLDWAGTPLDTLTSNDSPAPVHAHTATDGVSA